MKYKVGDKVRIKSLDWYNDNKNNFGKVWCANGRIPFDSDMRKYCGKVMTISHDRADHYTMVESLVNYWTDEMIEGLVEEETKPLTYEETVEIIETMQGIGDSWECPQGYQFVDENGNVINATKIVLEKKKKEYPKSYVECCDTLYRNSRHDECYEACLQGHPMQTFARLLICRDAYWKLYGEEMGLDGPWEPDWLDDDTKKYVITSTKVFETFGGLGYINYILAFPTEEMRDAFYENFKELIENCKELL